MSFAFNLFVWAVAGVIISVTLSVISCHAGQENQTPLSLGGITLLSTVIPGVLHMLLAAVVYFFRIDNAMEEQMRSEMATRK